MDVRRATVDDLASVVALQDANLKANLKDDQKADGFLSQRFSAEQFAEFDKSICLIVALDDARLGGFLCASTFEHNLGSPLVKVMYERLPNVRINGKQLNQDRTCLAGPICIDKDWRGKGVLEQLYMGAKDEIAKQNYQLILIFVSEQNPRSIKAHEKLGFAVVDRFEHAQNQYLTMSLALGEP